MGKVIDFTSKLSIDKWNGGKENMKEFIKLVLYFCNNCSREIYRTKLNKFLFYTQFYYFKLNNKKLLDEEFVFDYYGPVLKNLDSYLVKLNQLKLITLARDNYGILIKANVCLLKDSYSKNEIYILNKIIEKFDSWSSRQVSDYSHKESFWNDAKRGQVIDINNAFKLRELC